MKALFTFCLFMCLSSASANAAVPPADSVKTLKAFKHAFGLELLGNPLSVYYERRLYTTGKFSLFGLAGLNLSMIAVFQLPAFSLGVKARWQTKTSCNFFLSPRFDFLSFALPGYALTSEKPRQLSGFNLLSLNLGFGPYFFKNHWEFSPLYPAFIASYSLRSDGEDEVLRRYLSIGLSSRIAYVF